MPKKKIVVVDDNAANLTACKHTLKDLYEVYPAPSADKMFDILNHVAPEIILLDVEMPGTNGYEAMRMLKQNPAYKDIPVIFLSAMDDVESEMEGLELGAVDYIHKPIVSSLLLQRVAIHLSVAEETKELHDINQSIGNLLHERQANRAAGAAAADETIKELLTKGEFFPRIGHEIRVPLNNIFDMLEASVKTEDIGEIKQYLAKIDVESRLILEIVNDMLDVKGI